MSIQCSHIDEQISAYLLAELAAADGAVATAAADLAAAEAKAEGLKDRVGRLRGALRCLGYEASDAGGRN